MSIKGQVQAREINDYGYLRLKVSGTWYGADKKGDSPAAVGEIIEFEAYKNTKNYDTFKLSSLKKVAGAVKGAPVNPGPTASKDEYWAKKEANDAAKEPRISYYAASERAIQFVDLALRNGAIAAFAKSKETAKLDVLTALVDEQTQRILTASYNQAAVVPETSGDGSQSEAGEETGEEEDDGQTWN